MVADLTGLVETTLYGTMADDKITGKDAAIVFLVMEVKTRSMAILQMILSKEIPEMIH
jgi:hypothetical protein